MDSFIKQFGISAENHREETAIIDRDGTRATSYAQLDLMRRRIAAKILQKKLAPGSAVIINMDRCREYIAAYLGIQTAGCAAVPVTAEYPKERIAYIQKDCDAQLTITEDFFSDLADYEPAELVDVTANTPAHYAYTSGSTGTPKGVVHTVRSIYQVACGAIDLYDIGRKQIFASASTFSFFIFMYEVPRPLLLGAEVHIVSDSVRKDAVLLADYYLKHKINIGIISPQLLKNFHNKSPYLLRVITAGELVSNVYSDQYEIMNGYGSSETGIVSTFLLDKAYANTPIGKPIANCEFRIIPVDAGDTCEAEEGELCVIGPFAGKYLNLEQKSSVTFEAQEDGNILYRSGDIVRKNSDGNYIYLNRLDWMVKINGQRVETMEIETVLKTFTEIRNAAVKAFQDADGQNYLCAYYVKESPCTEAFLRSQLQKKLPPYMIPRFFVEM